MAISLDLLGLAMAFKRYSRCILWLTCFSLIISALISPLAQADELTLTPDTCAVTAEKPACRLDLLIEYQSDTPKSLCIWVAKHPIPLTCFENQIHFKYQVQLTLADDTLFELRDPKNNVITSGLVKVAKFEPANTRRRRGLNWNLL